MNASQLTQSQANQYGQVAAAFGAGAAQQQQEQQQQQQQEPVDDTRWQEISIMLCRLTQGYGVYAILGVAGTIFLEQRLALLGVAGVLWLLALFATLSTPGDQSKDFAFATLFMGSGLVTGYWSIIMQILTQYWIAFAVVIIGSIAGYAIERVWTLSIRRQELAIQKQRQQGYGGYPGY